MALLLAPADPLQKVARQVPMRHTTRAIAARFTKTVSTGGAIIGSLKTDCVSAETG
jgi:hypothetical protein